MLPVSIGGLGIRLASDLALPAFLPSVNGASELILKLLPSSLHAASANCDPLCIVASLEWQTRCNSTVPDPVVVGIQKAWDSIVMSQKQ